MTRAVTGRISFASGMDNGVHVLDHLALVRWGTLGFPESRLPESACVALDRARELPHPVSTGLAMHFACHVRELRREWDAAARLAEELIGARRASIALAHFRAWAATQSGAALIGRGELAAGIADLQRGVAELRERRGRRLWQPVLRCPARRCPWCGVGANRGYTRRCSTRPSR